MFAFALRPATGLCLVLLCLCAGLAAPLQARGASVYLEELTSPELRERIAAGSTTALVPIGGTEQNGAHMVLGKHNVRVHALAGLIAARLGNALVAPVIAYVPEGAIQPPTAHMRWAGTLSIPQSVFEAVLEATARSLKQHGFRQVFFLGDHGGYQQSEQRVAAKLSREWAADPSCQVHALLAYYRVTQTDYVQELKRRGYTEAQIGSHAGLADTSLALALDRSLVRSALLAGESGPGAREGISGDPRLATVALGQLGVDLIVENSLAAIRAATGAR
jgi:creatinine amidohydrolase/Fe(II)-dependent formamide hydrolase-like protein